MSPRTHAETIRIFLTESTPDKSTMRVEGTSMAPAIQKGDTLTVQRSVALTLGLGDVVVFYPDGWSHPCVHRLIWKRRHNDGSMRFYTKGDAQTSIECFGEAAFVGRVYEVRRGDRLMRGWKRFPLLRALHGCAVFAVRRMWNRLTRRFAPPKA